MIAPIALTGAGGSIGRAVFAAAEAEGVPVHALDAVALRAGDLAALAAELETVRPRAIIHLAGPTPARTDAATADPFAAHAALTALLLAAAERLGTPPRIVLASSAAVYGDAGGEPAVDGFDERAPLSGASPYAAAKRAAEELLRASTLPGVALRVFNVFGPGQGSSLVNRLASSTPAAPIELRAPERFVRDYVHVDDVARAFLRAAVVELDPALAAINIGSGEALSSARLVERLQEAGRAVHTTVLDGPPSRSVADAGLAAHALAWRATTPVERV